MSNPLSIERPPSTEPPRPGNRIVALSATGLLLVAVPAMLAVICWRWVTVHEPTSAVVIGGDSSLEGAVIDVTGQGKKFIVGLDRENGWQTPILLDPGGYHIKVTHHNQVILDEDFSIARLKGIRFTLKSMVVVTGGPPLSDPTIEIARESDSPNPFPPLTFKLNPLEHFRKAVYLDAGTYRAIALNGGSAGIAAQQEFIVDRTAPLHIDLAKAANEDLK